MADQTIVSFKRPTPLWATWLFRSVYVLSIAASFWVGGTKLIKDENKLEIVLALRVLDAAAWGMARGLGVKKTDFEEEGK